MTTGIRINDAPVEFAGYEYARVYDGEYSADEVVEIGEYDDLAEHLGSDEQLAFRAVYVTPWVPCT